MQANPLLAGTRVLDLSRLLPGPFCTLYLAQLGAEVIKVEEPNGGDYARAMGDIFSLVNRGKKSITLDLRKADDVARLHALVPTVEVLLESFRPGVMDRLGCGYQTLSTLNPKLVYASLTGYGHTGPYRDRPGHDMNYRGYAGELDQAGVAGGPPAVGNCQVADLAGGALTCAVGILAALLGARASGRGSFVDVAMMDGTLALQVASLAALRMTGAAPARGAGALSGALPNYAVYEAQDGRHVALGSLEYKFFARFCQLAGRPDLLKLPMAPGEPGRKLHEELAALFKTRTRDQWDALMAHEDTCLSGVLSLEESLRNPQVVARGLIESESGKPAFSLPIRFSAPLPVMGDSPKLGADNLAVLGKP